jgi:hypothetical protein
MLQLSLLQVFLCCALLPYAAATYTFGMDVTRTGARWASGWIWAVFAIFVRARFFHAYGSGGGGDSKRPSDGYEEFFSSLESSDYSWVAFYDDFKRHMQRYQHTFEPWLQKIIDFKYAAGNDRDAQVREYMDETSEIDSTTVGKKITVYKSRVGLGKTAPEEKRVHFKCHIEDAMTPPQYKEADLEAFEKEQERVDKLMIPFLYNIRQPTKQLINGTFEPALVIRRLRATLDRETQLTKLTCMGMAKIMNDSLKPKAMSWELCVTGKKDLFRTKLASKIDPDDFLLMSILHGIPDGDPEWLNFKQSMMLDGDLKLSVLETKGAEKAAILKESKARIDIAANLARVDKHSDDAKALAASAKSDGSRGERGEQAGLREPEEPCSPEGNAGAEAGS